MTTYEITHRLPGRISVRVVTHTRDEAIKTVESAQAVNAYAIAVQEFSEAQADPDRTRAGIAGRTVEQSKTGQLPTP